MAIEPFQRGSSNFVLNAGSVPVVSHQRGGPDGGKPPAPSEIGTPTSWGMQVLMVVVPP
jgi:hypothetical protein